MKALPGTVAYALACASLALLAACGTRGQRGVDGGPGAPGRDALVAVSVEPAGATCAQGGSRIEAGLDADGNGALSASEVTSTQVVCNGPAGIPATSGANGLDALVQMADEAAGANCAAGGKRVSVGLDLDGSGSLEAGEVTSTGYVCNGAAGLTTLLTISAEPAGANCTHGGTAINSGLDANRSGILDAGEIASTRTVCNGAPSLFWVSVGASVQAQPNTGYLADSAGAVVVVTLPASPALGDVVRVNGVGAGGWRIAQNAGQSIHTRNLDLSMFVVRDINRGWTAIASSADGAGLVAATWSGNLYTSADAGATWTARDSARNWMAVASSADGTKLVAVEWLGNVYTSADSGATWTPRDSARSWDALASSADGTKLVAAAFNDQLYTSADSGVTWTPRDSARGWVSVASSADGTKLLAAGHLEQLYTSTDSGATWTPRETVRDWRSVASSADGTRLLAAVQGGQLYTSTDSGATWTPRESARNWRTVASSSTGARLAAAVNGGQVYQSADGGATWAPYETVRFWNAITSSSDGANLAATTDADPVFTFSPWTTIGTGGFVSGAQYDAIELQYVGNGRFDVLSHAGSLAVQ